MVIKREGADGGNLDPTKIRGEGCRRFGSMGGPKVLYVCKACVLGCKLHGDLLCDMDGDSHAPSDHLRKANEPGGQGQSRRVLRSRGTDGGERRGVWRRERARKLGRAGNEALIT